MVAPEVRRVRQRLADEIEEQLGCEPGQMDCFRSGVGVHHSGLPYGGRKMIEDAYKRGFISVICCTPTLSTGVNLPARGVIIMAPWVGSVLLTGSKYLQMVGRAGRMPPDFDGDAILVMPQEAPGAATGVYAGCPVMRDYQSSELRRHCIDLVTDPVPEPTISTLVIPDQIEGSSESTSYLEVREMRI